MFLILEPKLGQHIFLYDNPEGTDCALPVQAVQLKLGQEEWQNWPDGQPAPEVSLGVALDDPNQFQIFKSPDDCRLAKFRCLGPNYAIFGDWAEYKRKCPA